MIKLNFKTNNKIQRRKIFYYIVHYPFAIFTTWKCWNILRSTPEYLTHRAYYANTAYLIRRMLIIEAVNKFKHDNKEIFAFNKRQLLPVFSQFCNGCRFPCNWLWKPRSRIIQYYQYFIVKFDISISILSCHFYIYIIIIKIQ